MKNASQKFLLSTSLVLCANTALAFAPTGEVVETSDSTITSTWQPTVAQRGDTIAEACEGFSYNTCVREFVLANRSMFPENFTAESDFFLREGGSYKVPTSAGVVASAEPAETAPEGSSMLEIINGFSAEQERQAGEIATLAESLSTLDVEDIGGLAASLQAISESVPDTGPLRAAVGGLEEALLLLQNGQMTDAMLDTIQTRIDTSLESLTAAVAGLQQANIEFDERLTGFVTLVDGVEVRVSDAETRIDGFDTRVTGFEGRLDGVEANNAQATFWTSFKGLSIIFGSMLLLLVGVIASWVYNYFNRRKVKVVADAQATTSATITELKTAQTENTDKFVEIEDRLNKVEENTDNNRRDLDGFQVDVDSMMEVKATDIETDKENLTAAQLAAMQPSDSEIQQTFYCQGNTYVVTFWRNEQTPVGYVDNNLLRRLGQSELLGPISVKKLHGRLAAAISSGRLRPTANVQAIAAE